MPVKRKGNSFLFDDEVVCLHFLPASKTLVCGSIKGGLQLLHENGQSTQVMPIGAHSARISSIKHYGNLIVVASKDRSVSLWRWPAKRDGSYSADAFKLVSKLPRTRTWELPAEALDMDEKFLVVGHGITEEGYVVLWKRGKFEEMPQKVSVLEYEDVGVESVLLRRDLVACGMKNGAVALNRIEGGAMRPLRSIPSLSKNPISSLCPLPDESVLMVTQDAGAFVVDVDKDDDPKRVVNPAGGSESSFLVGAAATWDDSNPLVFLLSGAGRLISLSADAVVSAKRDRSLDLATTSCSELFPARRISFKGQQRFAPALPVSRVFCVNPENWKDVQFASFNVV